MKKVVIILTACIMSLLFTVKTPVYAAEYYGDFQYEESEDSVAVYSYNGAEKEVSIPAYIKDKPVTEIKDYAFLLCNSVEKIIVPSTVKTIGGNAFSGVSNLKEVVYIPEDTKVGETEESVRKEETGVLGNVENTDNPEIADSAVDNNKPNNKVSPDSENDTADKAEGTADIRDKNESNLKDKDNGIPDTNDEIAGADEGIDTVSENPENTKCSTGVLTDTDKNEDSIEKDGEKSGNRVILIVSVAAAVVLAGILILFRMKKRK